MAKPSRAQVVVGALVAVVVLSAAVAGVVWLRGDDETASTTTTTEATTTTGPLSAEFTIDDLLTRDAQYGRFLELAEGTGVLRTLGEDGEVTALIPSTDAFEGVDVPGGEAERAALLRRHLVEGTLDLGALIELDGDTVTTLDGQQHRIAVGGNTVTVGGVELAKTNIYADNGVIHVLDGVLPAPG